MVFWTVYFWPSPYLAHFSGIKFLPGLHFKHASHELDIDCILNNSVTVIKLNCFSDIATDDIQPTIHYKSKLRYSSFLS